uniref:Uncharacterized protein n=1 Tax=Cannabis sativa TaxID=3483 RepID=A0A803P5I9_CANSA
MISPDGLRLQATLRIMFSASNNEAKYEALIEGLKLSKVVGPTKPDKNGQSEVVNKILKVTLKKKLLARRTTTLACYGATGLSSKNLAGHSPFSMVYGSKAMDSR